MTAPSVGESCFRHDASVTDRRHPRHSRAETHSVALALAFMAGRGAALAGLLYAAWRWNRRRALGAALLPYEIALARLEEARALMQPENAREFSIAVSEIVRQYIEERFQVWAARRTTEEFLHDLLEPSDALLASHRALLEDFLRHCDLAKFAARFSRMTRWKPCFKAPTTSCSKRAKRRHLKPSPLPCLPFLKEQPRRPNRPCKPNS